MARDLARKAAADVANGVDPRAKKRAAKAATAEPALDLIETVVTEYIERYAKKQTRERSWRETERLLKREVVSQWRGRSIAAIRRKDVVALLDPIADRAPVIAIQTLAALRHMCAWALKRGLIEVNPAAGIDAPAKMIARDRTLTDVELAVLWRSAETLGYPAGPIVQLLALTGSRLREVSEMRWSEVDLAKAVWVLPAARAKNKQEHSIPLAPMAIKLLEGLPRFASCDEIFSYDGKGAVASMTRPKRSLDAAMRRELPDLAPFVIHDIRRSVASGLGALGVQPHIIEAALNHRSGVISGLARTYNRHAYAGEKAVALRRWADHVERLVSGETAANVIEMAKARG